MEEEVAEGKSGEVAKWRSGGVAEWQSGEGWLGTGRGVAGRAGALG